MSSSRSDYIQTNDVPAFLAAHERTNMSDLDFTIRDAGNVTLAAGKISMSNEANGWHTRYHDLILANDEQGQREHVISKIMLVTTELAEAVEELRNGRGVRERYYSHSTQPGYSFTAVEVAEAEGLEASFKPEGVPAELADAIIRLFDLTGMLGIDIGAVMKQKVEYNATRGKMHGGKTI